VTLSCILISRYDHVISFISIIIIIINIVNVNVFTGWDSVVGIATRYGLDGLRTESLWRRDFPHLSWPVVKPTQPPVQCVPGLFSGGKAAGCDVNHPTLSSAEVKERVEL
jgi:hypothetical protein